jgi:acetylornithine/succinyldiaminopimelate/putrescine aminotransferase
MFFLPRFIDPSAPAVTTLLPLPTAAVFLEEVEGGGGDEDIKKETCKQVRELMRKKPA